MDVSVTLKFSSVQEAIAELAKLSPGLAPDDFPTTGQDNPVPPVPVPPVPPVPASPEQAFGLAPAPAPAAPTPPAPPASGVVMPALDKEGLPWDSGIHTDSKTQNKDGTWKLKRNLADQFVQQVRRELTLAQGAAPALPIPGNAALIPPAAPNVPPVPAAGSLPPLPHFPPPPVVPQQVAAPPIAPVAAPPSAPPQPAAPLTFPAFLGKYASIATQNEALYQSAITQSLAQVGLTALGQLAARPDLIAQVDLMMPAFLSTPQ